VEDSWSAQAAQIVAAKPDLVIASVPYQLEAVAEILKAGIRFLGLAPRTLADIYTDIKAIAGVMGVPARGELLVQSMDEEIAVVRATAKEAETKPRVFCEEWGKPLIASQPWVAELIEAAGGEFVGTPGKHTTAETVAAEAPDVIIAAWCGAGDRVPLEKIVSQRNWSELPAVRAGRVYCLRDEFLNTPGPTLMQGLHALAHAIHPDLYPAVPGVRRISSL
jgi:iron complex transport system substrate-binding protein